MRLEIGNKSFDEMVQEMLGWYRDHRASLGVGGLWMRAGLESVVSGRLVDPPVDALKACLRPELAWDVPEWPMEELSFRMSEIADCNLFAIALGDQPWMQGLKDLWTMPRAESDWQEIALWQLDLGLTGQSPAWEEDDLSILFELHTLDENDTAHLAWAALFRGDFEAARLALEAHRAELDARARQWSSSHGNQAYGILLNTSRILRLDVRAIGAILGNVDRHVRFR